MSKYKKIEVTPYKYRQMQKEIIGQVFILCACYLMEEHNYGKEDVIALWDAITRQTEAIRSKTITMNKVCQILNEHTGTDIRWNL